MADISLELIGRRLDAIQTELREFKFAVDVDRRDAVSWRTNLVIEVGAKLATFELHIDNRLAAMDDKLAQAHETLAAVDEKLVAMGEKLTAADDKLGVGLARVDDRLARIEALLHQIGSR